MFGNKLDLQISKLYCLTHGPRISENDHHKPPCLQQPFLYLAGLTKTLKKPSATEKLAITSDPNEWLNTQTAHKTPSSAEALSLCCVSVLSLT